MFIPTGVNFLTAMLSSTAVELVTAVGSHYLAVSLGVFATLMKPHRC